MEEVESEDEPFDEEQIAKLKDLGVVIHFDSERCGV